MSLHLEFVVYFVVSTAFVVVWTIFIQLKGASQTSFIRFYCLHVRFLNSLLCSYILTCFDCSTVLMESLIAISLAITSLYSSKLRVKVLQLN